MTARGEDRVGAQWVATLDAAVDRSTTEPLVHRHHRLRLYAHRQIRL